MTHVFGVGEHVTRDGRRAVVVSSDCPHHYPLIGWVQSPGGDVVITGWTERGRMITEESECPLDLVVPAPWSAKLTLKDGVNAQGIYKHGRMQFLVTECATTIMTIVNLLNAGEAAK